MGLPDEPLKPRCRAFDPGHNRKKKSKSQEKRVAKKLGANVQPASGSKGLPKGDQGTSTGRGVRGYSVSPSDISATSFLVEAKRTDSNSIRIEGRWLDKIEAEALTVGKKPALTLEIGGRNALCEKDWVLITAEDFRKLTDS